ncbi:MAG: gliding motility-associated C-terminal domain-containing protein [Bacteroidia bacterium]
MKRKLLLSVFLLSVLSSFASESDRFWVGGSGIWSNPAHWSTTDGGNGGASVPDKTTRVYFTAHSFQTPKPVITLPDSVFCADFNCSETGLSPVFVSSGKNPVLTISGSFQLPSFKSISFPYKGKIIFNSSGNSQIDFHGSQYLGSELEFNGTGSWSLVHDIVTANHSILHFVSGHLLTMDHNLCFGYFNGEVKSNGTLDLGKSSITVYHKWVMPNSRLSVNSSKANIFFNDTLACENFRTRAMIFNNIHTAVTCNNPPLSVTLTSDSVICNGQCNGAVHAIASGGGGPYGYAWAAPALCNTPDCVGLCANTYLVTVTDSSTMNTISCSIGIAAPATLVINFSITSTLPCNGSCTGAIKSNPNGGNCSPSYAYSWTTGQTTQTISALCAGTYTLTVTDCKGCTATQSKVLGQPTPIVTHGTFTNVTCFGLCNGSASVAPTGGTPGYTYLWSNGAVTAGISNLCPGSYTCTVKDANGCTKTYVATITQPAAPLSSTFTTTNNPLACNGVCNATASVTVSGGTPPYAYSWSPGGITIPSLSGLCAGVYVLHTTDANGCTLATTVTITQPAVINVTLNPVNLVCAGACNGSISSVVTGGTGAYTYSWSNGTTLSTVNGLCAGSYTLTVTDANGCTGSNSVTITQPPALNITLNGTNITCFGLCNGGISSVVSGGTGAYTYSWAPGNPTGQGTGSISFLCAGTYTLTVTDANHCTLSKVLTITQPPALVDNASATNQTCSGLCNGSVTASPVGGNPAYSYLWNPGAANTQTVNALCAGNYTLTVTDASGCTKTQIVTIGAPAALTVSISSTNISCNGLCDGTASGSVSGGTAPYTYSWASGPTTSSISSLCAGTYTLTVTDANGCTGSNVVTINSPSALVANASATPVNCSGVCNGSATAAPTGGTGAYTYSWQPVSLTTQTINNICAGNYTVTVTDAHGCSVNQIVTVTAPLTILANVTVTNVKCSGSCNGTATAAPTGGTGAYTYSWNTGAVTVGIVGLCAGNYTCKVTDSHGCTGTQVVTVTQPAVLSASVGGSTSTCGNCQGTATVSVSGGTPRYTYSWNTAPAQTTPTASSLCVGNYTCTVTDANGCTTTTVATITQTVNITITSSSTNLTCHSVCNGTATANPSGGTAPYSYTWSTAPVQNTQNATGLCAGSYTVTVDDVNGCFASASVTFTNPALLSPTISKLSPSCNGLCNGSASVSTTGGTGAYTYSWTPGGQTTNSISALCAGTYTLDVKDANGCDSVASFIINQPAPILPHPAPVTPSTCAACDGSITVAPTGGTSPYTYSWNPVAGATPTVSSLCAGSYTVTIHDNSGCDTVAKITLSSPSGPSAVMSFTPASCNGTCDGTATAAVSGGTPPYTFTWSPGNPAGQGTTHITGLCAGTYTIKVVDNIGCTVLVPVTVTQPAAFVLTPTITNVSCGGANNGSINVAVTGGTAPYTYAWNTGSTSNTISLLSPGNYTVTVTDSHGCVTSAIYPITQPSVLNVSITTVNVTCNGACNGSATTVVSGGTAPYTYSWSNGATASNITNLCPGSYTVKVTDAMGCFQSQICTITQPPLLTSSVTSTNATCNGTCNGTANDNVAGGTPPYSYSWSPGSQTINPINSLCAGVYCVTTTDSKGCTSIACTTITEPPAIVISIAHTDATCNGSCNGSATGTVSGGTGAYTYSWTPSGGIGASAIGLCAGTYTLTVTDANGCTASLTVTISQPAPLLCNATSTNPTCHGSCNGTATSTPVGGTAPFTYSWNTGATTASINGLCSGTYTVKTTDTKGCTDQQTVVITDPASISGSSAVADANCGVCNGTISLIASGGNSPYSYTWTPAGVTGQGTPNISNLCAGNYIVKITDANGCTSTLPAIPVNNTGGPTSASITITDPTCSYKCNGSAVINSVTGGTPGYTYTWFDSTGFNMGVSITTITNLCRGGYIARITDASGCIYSQIVNLGSPAPIASNSSVIQNTCSGLCNASINVAPTGGTGVYTYLWSPGGQTTPNISNLCAGADTVKISDANGCDSVFTFIIAPVTVLTGALTKTNPPCANTCGGSATISMTTGTAPYAYSWTDPLGQSASAATSLCGGTYTVTVTDANGCFIKPTTTLTAPMAVTGTPGITAPTCGSCNGSASISPAGGTAPYTYLWSNGSNTANASNLCAGVYSLTVYDANNCATTFSVPVSNSSGPAASTMTSVAATCHGSCNGTATASPNGGLAPYTFNWIPGGQTTASITAQCAGLYFVQVTDQNGCTRTDSITIHQPAGINTNQVVLPSKCGSANGSITLSPTGGTSPYTYAWSNALPPAAAQSGLPAGFYNVTITDGAGCNQLFNFSVNSSNSPSLTNITHNALCNGACNGRDTVTPTGGSPGYTYSWVPAPGAGAGTNIASLMCAGSYTVQVTDASGCANSATFTITQPQAISFSNPLVTNILCHGLCNGKITSIPSGGTAPYTYSWNPGTPSATATDTGLCAGTYTLYLNDRNGCLNIEHIPVTQPPAMAFTSALTSPHCDNVAGGSIAITPVGGTAPFTYAWTGPGAFTSTSQNPSAMMGGTYTLTVTDGNGCKEIIHDTLKPVIVLDANAGPNKNFCALGVSLLDGTASINAFQYKWYQMPGMVLVDTNAIAHLTPPLGTTQYTLIVYNSGCTDTATVSVSSNSPPVVSAGPTQTILTNSSTVIGGSPTCITATSFVWSPSTGVQDTASSNPTVDPLVTTTYTITVTDGNGCKATDTVEVIVLPELIFPSGITPNGDGVNDVWVIGNINHFPNNVVEIYNRWGELLFQAKDYQNNWNGMYQGKQLPVGTYYYLIDLHDPLYKKKYSGPITIMR